MFSTTHCSCLAPNVIDTVLVYICQWRTSFTTSKPVEVCEAVLVLSNIALHGYNCFLCASSKLREAQDNFGLKPWPHCQQHCHHSNQQVCSILRSEVQYKHSTSLVLLRKCYWASCLANYRAIMNRERFREQLVGQEFVSIDAFENVSRIRRSLATQSPVWEMRLYGWRAFRQDVRTELFIIRAQYRVLRLTPVVVNVTKWSGSNIWIQTQNWKNLDDPKERVKIAIISNLGCTVSHV